MTKNEEGFEDLVAMRSEFKDHSVWRLKNGMQELVTNMKKRLLKKNVTFLMNEPVNRLKFEEDHVEIESKSNTKKVDFVISGIYSKC